jgi:hypothetical protein
MVTHIFVFKKKLVHYINKDYIFMVPWLAAGGYYLPGGHKEMSSIWLTNSALVHEPKCGGRVAGSQPMSTAVHMLPE